MLPVLILACSEPTPDGMVAIRGGSFIMGRERSGHPDETPAHAVQISAFVLDETLVTVEDFRVFVDASGHRTDAEAMGSGKTATLGMGEWEWTDQAGATWKKPWPIDAHVQRDDEPVVMVSWTDADAYCAAQGKRLPTEAEWEYAMRAGSTARFPRGSEPVGLNYWEGADHTENPATDGHVYTAPVKTHPPNAWGLYDPVGNVWQFVADWYAADTFSRGDVADPKGPDTGELKVGRGGSWWCSASACSGYGLFARGKTHPRAAFSNNGFRCAR